MPVEPTPGTEALKESCKKRHFEARWPKQEKECGGTCMLGTVVHRWHVCSVCVNEAEEPFHPAWRDH